MSDTDRLAEIKAALRADPDGFRRFDVDWLIGEVEQLRRGPDAFSRMHEHATGLHRGLETNLDERTQLETINAGLRAEVGRLRGRLAELEWACSISRPQFGCCPACHHGSDEGHAPDCWLAAELAQHPEAQP